MKSRIPLSGVLFISLACVVSAGAPQWWTTRNVTAPQPPKAGEPGYDAQAHADWMAENYGPALLGQAKHFAKQAYLEMEHVAPGSAGEKIETMVSSFSTSPEANYAPLLLGQLKAIAKPFYERFAEIGYVPEGIPLKDPELYPFPWNDQTPIELNYQPANIGQMKHVFSFDLEAWAGAGDPWWAVPAAWKQRIVDFDPSDGITSLADVLPEDDFNGNGISNFQEYLAGTDPIDFFSGLLPHLEAMSDEGLVARVGSPLLTPVVVRLTEQSSGLALSGKPVRFRVDGGTLALSAVGSEPGEAETIVIYTDENGLASCRVRQDGEIPSQLSAFLITGGEEQSLAFTVRSWGVSSDGVFVGGDHSAYRSASGSVGVWGRNQFGQSGLGHANPISSPTVSGSDFSQVAMGSTHSLGIAGDGTLFAWGANDFGQLGDGTRSTQWVPVPVVTPSLWTGRTVIELAAGDSFSLALLDDGSVWAWGLNASGQLGLGEASPENVSIPTRITGLPTIRTLAAGARHALAITQAGELYAWGENRSGQSGVPGGGHVSIPTSISLPHGREAVAVAAGREHSLVLTREGTVEAWGSNVFGQIATGDERAHGVPQTVPLPEPTVAIACGDYTAFAVSETGRAWGWGAHSKGQLGSVMASGDQPLPVELHTHERDVIGLGAGRDHAFLIDETGATYLWGDNTYHQLGSDAPQPILLETAD